MLANRDASLCLASSSSTKAHNIQFREGEASLAGFFSGTIACLHRPEPLHKTVGPQHKIISNLASSNVQFLKNIPEELGVPALPYIPEDRDKQSRVNLVEISFFSQIFD